MEHYTLEIQENVVQVPVGAGTGWAQYTDTQYPDENNAFTLLANEPMTLPNNAGKTLEIYQNAPLPWYDGLLLRPSESGDGMGLRVDLAAKPTQANTSLWLRFFIGAPQRSILNTVVRLGDPAVAEPYSLSFNPIYALDDFFASGGRIEVEATQDVEIFGINYVISRNSKATLNA